MYRLIKTLVRSSLLLGILGGQLLWAQTDSDAYRAARGMEDPAQRIEALQQFMVAYPESESSGRAWRDIYYAALSLEKEALALEAAENYLNSLSEGQRGNGYNQIAWTLAENKLGLDAAARYAELAVAWARTLERPGTLRNILDTQAYVLYQKGDAAAAEKIQLEALEGNENNGDMLGRLALYQAGAGKRDAAIRTIAKALLLDGRSEDLQHFHEWLAEAAPDAGKRKALQEVVVRETVDNYLKEAFSPGDGERTQAAVFLAKTGVDLKKATEWARNAVAQLDAQSPVNDVVRFNARLATVYFYQNKYAEAVKTAEKVWDYVDPWNEDFWYVTGQSYEKLGKDDQALAAYLQGVLVNAPETLDGALKALYSKVHGNTEGLDELIDKTRQEVSDFEPGKYQPGPSSGRVVLAEMFTGAECGPCVSANYAYKALAGYYPRSVVAIVKYHMHIPGPDPMTNSDTEARYQYYGGNFGMPTSFIDGGEKMTGGGPKVVTKNRYVTYDRSIRQHLQQKPLLTLKAKVDLQQDVVKIEVDLKALDQKALAAKTLRLNVALVEREIDYEGSNRVPHHNFVARKLLGGAEGLPLQLTEKALKLNQEIDLKAVENDLATYLDDYAARRLGEGGWKQRLDKLDRDDLAIVAWVQDNDSKQVLQAFYQDVPAASAAR
ncbi:MAG: hypothetical protein KDH97_01020 [Calditrichaeota bacterium]|nr:hypothetical protein [Calditrichota bacterium]